MNHHKLFLGFFLWLIPFALSAQRFVSGRITDAASGEPVYGANVFITGTTVGAATDASGDFRLQLPAGEGNFRLAVSHVGYQPVFKDVEPGQTSIIINVSLHLLELGEVSVTAKASVRKSDIDLFWRTILGKKPTKKTISVTNPETVYYYYNSETQKLTVTCREPLQIVNNETGYRMLFVLKYFTHYYKSDISSWEGEYMFTELKSNNYKQKINWENNRKMVYKSSITNFIKALYLDSFVSSISKCNFTGVNY